MKPFFSIRIDYNPADSDGQIHRDNNSVRISVARQSEPDDTSDDAAAAQSDATADDRTEIIDSVVRAIRFMDQAMRGISWSFLDDVVRSTAIYMDEDQIAELIEEHMEGASDEFIDRVQAAIDSERPRKGPSK